MITTIHWLDVAEYLANRKQPSVLLQRPAIDPGTYGGVAASRTGEFLVPTSPLTATPVIWHPVTRGDYVRIPVHAYCTPLLCQPTPAGTASAASALVACALELGVQAGMTLKAPPLGLTLVLGTDCDFEDIDGGQVCRYYCGLAFQTA